MGERRQPKGIPTGGRFAGGRRRAADIGDLAEQDANIKPSLFDGVDWKDAGPAPGRTLRFREIRGRAGARLFHDRIAELKRTSRFAAAVDVHDPDEYERCRMFLSEDGRADFALAEDDELVSVFSYKGAHAGDDIVGKAVEQGARRLDCYDIKGFLPRLYGGHGFRPVAYVDWDDDYAPDGWDYAKAGRPRVAAMALTGEDVEPVEHVGYDEAVDMAKRIARGGPDATSAPLS